MYPFLTRYALSAALSALAFVNPAFAAAHTCKNPSLQTAKEYERDVQSDDYQSGTNSSRVQSSCLAEMTRQRTKNLRVPLAKSARQGDQQ